MTVHDFEICTCNDCIDEWMRVHYPHLNPQKEEDLPKKTVIKIQKVVNQGELPPFLGVAQRHFEKAKPAVGGSKDTLNIDVGMLEFLLPQPLVQTIESVQILYEAKP